MTEISVGDLTPTQRKCQYCGDAIPADANASRVYCSARCRNNAWERRHRRTPSGTSNANRGSGRPYRRPLPIVASDAAWKLRKDVERLERIVADDRFPQNKEQVAALLHGHLTYAAEACQALISQINHSIGE